MIPRDTLFESAHFETIIDRLRGEMSRRPLSALRNLPKIVFAMYSSGYPLVDVRSAYVDYLVEVSQRSKKVHQAPDDVVQPMSFALMFGVSAEERDMLQSIATMDDCNEPFQAFLEDALGLEHPRVQGKGNLWRFFRTILDIEGKEDKEAFIAHYLKKAWYNSNRNEYWYGDHTGGAMYYVGYWAWEIGGLVKAYGLDDSSFRNNRYYPGDMAHFLDAA
jgi:hypothetical protein